MIYDHTEGETKTHPVRNAEPARNDEPVTPAPSEPQPFKTGSKYLDEGAVCERANHVGSSCFMEDGQRKRIIGRIEADVPIIHSNYLLALERARIQALLHKKAGWGPVAEMLFSLASAALLAGVGYAVAQVAKIGVKGFLAEQDVAIGIDAGKAGISMRAAQKAAEDTYVGAHADLAKSLVKNTTTALKPAVKAQFEHWPADVAIKGAFITQLMNAASGLFTGARDAALENGDDAVLISMLGAFSPKFMTIDYFSGLIEKLLERFDNSHIADIGPLKQGAVTAGTTETVLVAAHGFSRLAIVQFGEHKVLGRSQGETWYTDGSSYFLNFVDDDFIEAATAVQQQSVGNIKVIDVHQGHKFNRAAALDAWIERARGASQRKKA